MCLVVGVMRVSRARMVKKARESIGLTGGSDMWKGKEYSRVPGIFFKYLRRLNI